jgi:hypothetical protein
MITLEHSSSSSISPDTLAEFRTRTAWEPKKKKKKTDLTDAQITEILARKQAGEKKSYACRAMFGTAGGDVWYAFSDVWEQADAQR